MPPKRFKFPLSEFAFGSVYFRTTRGIIVEFVVKLHMILAEVEYEVLRYDTAHGGTHKDVLLPDGSKFDVVPYHYLSPKDALTFAIQDIYNNWKFYTERFERWINEKKILKKMRFF